jgi:hypothetical protein
LYEKVDLASTGSTGNITGNSIFVDSGWEGIALQFVVEAVGATPTVTYKYQASPDGVNWYDVGYVTDASDTISQATRARTATGADIEFLSNPLARKYRFFRVVTSANTNVTFRAELYRISS